MSIGVLIALVITLLVLVFARDVSRAAHNAATVRRSEDLSFAALANSLLTSENQVDAHLAYLMVHGSTLSRPVFAARLDQIDQVVVAWPGEGERLALPKLAHNVNGELDNLTQTRAAATEALIAGVEHSLALPVTVEGSSPGSDAAAALRATALAWNTDRFALVHEPGRVHLLAVSSRSASDVLGGDATALDRSVALAVHRAIGIAAVRVIPSPLPAKSGTLLEPPVARLTIDVSVANLAYAVQPVSLTLSVTPLNGRGAPSNQRARATLGPLGAWAFSLASVTTAPNERARVVVRVTGAPAGATLPVTETYSLVLSPSGGH